MTSIFNLFKTEKITVRKTTRGELTDSVVYEEELTAIVKRRTNSVEGGQDDELYSNATTVHFKPTDYQYIELGNYVLIDGLWRNIQGLKDGMNYHTGKKEFILAALGDEIKNTDSPNWGA